MADMRDANVDYEGHDYDAILVVSFGGPEGPDDVMPFLDNVLRGLNIPLAAKERIAKRYQHFGGVSPINAETRAFIAALESELRTHGIDLPVYWGNRNWHPLLADTLERMQADGIKRVLAHVTSTFASYSGCRKYREDLYEATAALEQPLVIDKLRLGFNHPRFLEAVVDRTRAAFEQVPASRRADTPLLFTAHSLPLSMDKTAPYVEQLREACGLVAAALKHDEWALAYQSNNAAYGEPWLETDICEVLRGLGESGIRDVVVMPIGFVCDHMEIVLDLDIEAQAAATGAGVNMVRAATVGTHPAYVGMVRELIQERLTPDAERLSLGSLGPSHDFCPADCCLSGRPGDPKPALCGVPGAEA
jgi:ferrochelatase